MSALNWFFRIFVDVKNEKVSISGVKNMRSGGDMPRSSSGRILVQQYTFHILADE